MRGEGVPSDGGGSGGGGGGGGDSKQGLLALYLRLLEEAPLLTKCATSGALNFLGDFLCQTFLGDKDSSYDWARSFKFTFLGLVLVGPALHFWYQTLGKGMATLGLTGNAKALVSLVLDQFCFAPLFIASFFSALLTIDGKASEIPSVLRKDLKSAVVTNWGIWIPGQFLNFRFVPLNLQVLCANCIALVWNTYLSFATHKSHKAEA